MSDDFDYLNFELTLWTDDQTNKQKVSAWWTKSLWNDRSREIEMTLIHLINSAYVSTIAQPMKATFGKKGELQMRFRSCLLGYTESTSWDQVEGGTEVEITEIVACHHDVLEKVTPSSSRIVARRPCAFTESEETLDHVGLRKFYRQSTISSYPWGCFWGSRYSFTTICPQQSQAPGGMESRTPSDRYLVQI